jgi:hypothetical protein
MLVNDLEHERDKNARLEAELREAKETSKRLTDTLENEKKLCERRLKDEKMKYQDHLDLILAEKESLKKKLEEKEKCHEISWNCFKKCQEKLKENEKIRELLKVELCQVRDSLARQTNEKEKEIKERYHGILNRKRDMVDDLSNRVNMQSKEIDELKKKRNKEISEKERILKELKKEKQRVVENSGLKQKINDLEKRVILKVKELKTQREKVEELSSNVLIHYQEKKSWEMCLSMLGNSEVEKCAQYFALKYKSQLAKIGELEKKLLFFKKEVTKPMAAKIG